MNVRVDKRIESLRTAAISSKPEATPAINYKMLICNNLYDNFK